MKNKNSRLNSNNIKNSQNRLFFKSTITALDRHENAYAFSHLHFVQIPRNSHISVQHLMSEYKTKITNLTVTIKKHKN